MKQKIFNRILSVYNILVYVLLKIIQLSFGREFLFELKVQWAAIAISNNSSEILLALQILLVIVGVANLICIIANRKNKKLMIWYGVSTICYVFLVLSIFEIDIISTALLSKLWAIIPAIFLLISLIIVVRKKKENKKLVIILHILGIIMCVAMFFFDDYNEIIWLVIATIMQFVRSKEEMEQNKFSKILNIILVLILIGTFSYVIIKQALMLLKLKSIDNESAEYIEKIQTATSNESINNDEKLIKVCRDNKWGYINQKGQEVIKCEYEAASNSYYNINILMTRKDNTYYILDKKGTILVTNNETPTPFLKGNVLQELRNYNWETDINGQDGECEMLDTAIIQIKNYLKYNVATDEDNEQYNDDMATEKNNKNILEMVHRYNNDNNNYVYKYNINDGYKIEVEEIDNHKYNIEVIKNNEVIKEYKNIGLIMDEYADKYGTILTYSNGDIPFYNFDTQTQGFFNKDNLEETSLNGDYQILDVIEDKIFIRDYTDKSNIQEVVINTQGEILIRAKQIDILETGYIVKKENDKMVYMDSEFNEKTKEYDSIRKLDIDGFENLLICSNIENNDKKCDLCDFEGNVLTKQKYQLIGFDYSHIERESYYILDTIYKEHYGSD